MRPCSANESARKAKTGRCQSFGNARAKTAGRHSKGAVDKQLPCLPLMREAIARYLQYLRVERMRRN